jgi:tetratricopeptide (TPR) repeat protein
MSFGHITRIRDNHASMIRLVLCTFVWFNLGVQPGAAQITADQIPKVDVVGIPEDMAKLIEEATDIAKKSPTDPEKIGELGMLLLRVTKLNKAAECFELAIKLQPGGMRWYYFLGMVQEQLLETKLATATYRKCLDLDASYAPTMIRLADLIVNEDAKQAEALYQSAQKLSPNDPRIYFGFGECARVQRQQDQALTHYLKAVEIAPQYAQAHGVLSRIYAEKGDKVNADIHHTAEKSGREPKVVMDPLYIDLMSKGAVGDWLLDTANQLIMSGDFDLAAKFIARAGKSKLYSDEANKQLGLLSYYRQDYPKAVEFLTKYLNEIRGDDDNRLILAKTFIEMRRYPDASRELKAIIRSRPEQMEALELNAMVCAFLGRPEAGVADLLKVIRIDSKRQSAFASLVVTHIASGNLELAVKTYQTALKAFSAPSDLDENVLISLMSLIQVRENISKTEPGGTTIKPSCFGAFAEALSKADYNESADRVANYLRTVAQAIERNAATGQFSMAFTVIDKVGAADEGGYIRDAMTRTYSLLNQATAVGAKQFFQDNEPIAQTDATLASLLAWIRATSPEDGLRNSAEAVRFAEIADRLTSHKNPEIMDTLAAAYAEAGDFNRAIKSMQDALQHEKTQSSKWRAERFKQRLELYEKKTPYRH